MRQYLDMLRFVMEEGVRSRNRTGVETLSVFGHQTRYDLREGFPLATTKRVFFRGVVEELFWFLRGSTNRKDLSARGVHIWDEWGDENGELGPVYGKQWRRWEGGRLIVRDKNGVVGGTWSRPIDGHSSIPIDAVDNMIVRQSLMTINRAELQAEIEAALELGPVVLDRWYASSLAYGVAEGLNPDWIRRISSVLLEPDAWILLDVDPEIAMKRRPTARDANERDFAKLHRVRRAYLELFAGGEEGARLALPNRPRPSDALRSVRPRIPSGKTVNWYVVDAELPQHIVRDTVWSIATYAVLLTKERA